MASEIHDREMEQYRNLLATPTEFKDGFGWTTVVGILFCGLVMMPGGIYLSLMTGQGLGQAGSWVTVILFMEIARRALKPLSKHNLVILLHASHVMMAGTAMFFGGPFSQMVYRAYVVTSETVRDAGMSGAFPTWWAPPANSPAVTERLLFHKDWLAPVGLAFFLAVIGLVKKYTMGYFFFRLTSDIENLPFPLAPIRAQGAMALAESEEEAPQEAAKGKHALARSGPKKGSLRWRIFALGVTLGISFGFFSVGIPALTDLILSKPVFLIPQPFVDTTVLTEQLLPATPTGIVFDLGVILLGFVLPFWSVIGTFSAIVLTLILNPVLYHAGVLSHWQPGMNTVNTTFSNSIDFWLSFTIGSSFGIAACSVFATIKDVRTKLRDLKNARKQGEERESIWATPEKGRGDYPLWLALVIYCVVAIAMIALCYHLLPHTKGVLFFLIFFAFFYNPFISYLNARLLGISGQAIEIPHIKEAMFLLSGARGISIWLAPVPIDHFGEQAQAFRVNELTGVSFRSLLKTDIVAMPVLFVLSFVFWSFIWRSNAIPSDIFPAASINWELAVKNQTLIWSSTFQGIGTAGADRSIMDSEFMGAIHPRVMGISAMTTITLYTVLQLLGMPVMLIYGMVRGFGALPHTMALEIVGAMVGRFYFQRRYGRQNFLRTAPALMAGYFTGVGLIAMSTIAMKLIKMAVSAAPF